MKIAKNDRVVMIGDSVTDCGRVYPIGEDHQLGNGYVALFSAMLDSRHPELAARVTNMGINGHTVRDLKARWQTDVLDLSPDWVTIMIGINDVWRQFDHPKQKETHVLPDEYERTLEELVRATLPHVKGIVLLPPTYMNTNATDAMRMRRDEYAQIVRNIAQRTGCMLADAQGEFDRVYSVIHPIAANPDYVHPDFTGHLMIAEEIYRTLE